LVITGGEPTIYANLPDFLVKVKELNLAVKLDTNGSNPAMLEEILKERLADYIALDVKAPLTAEKYGRASGLEDGKEVCEAVRRSIFLLLNSYDVEYEFRTTVVPKLLDKHELLLIAEELRGAKGYYLQQFKRAKTHVDESYAEVIPYPMRELEEIKRKVADYFELCEVRG
jgi:pyruvate formate lyase activating enzyme